MFSKNYFIAGVFSILALVWTTLIAVSAQSYTCDSNEYVTMKTWLIVFTGAGYAAHLIIMFLSLWHHITRNNAAVDALTIIHVCLFLFYSIWFVLGFEVVLTVETCREPGWSAHLVIVLLCGPCAVWNFLTARHIDAHGRYNDL